MTLEKGVPVLTGATVFALLVSLSLAAAPAAAVSVAPPYALAAEPVWATLNAAAQGNYPGGNEVFDIFVVNSGHPSSGNVTVLNETLTAPALPPGQQSNYGIGLPAVLAPGVSLLSTIALEIPSDFKPNNFTANLVVNVLLWNGTANIPLRLTGSAQVFMLALPGSATATQTTTSMSESTSASTTTQSGTVSMTLFEIGVAIPSIIAVVLLVLLARGRRTS